MTKLLSQTTGNEISALRDALTTAASAATDVAAVAQHFTARFCELFPTTVLARVFVVVPFGELGDEERALARAALERHESAPAAPTLPVLCLLATSGAVPAWNDRRLSSGHRAIPLVKGLLSGAPMLTELLAALELDLAHLSDRRSIGLRRLAGSTAHRFFVPDARATVDQQGRQVIGSQDFVGAYDVRSVFGMGGAYLDGTLVASLFFTSELLDTLTVDHFPSLITSFKIATARIESAGHLFPAR